MRPNLLSSSASSTHCFDTRPRPRASSTARDMIESVACPQHRGNLFLALFRLSGGCRAERAEAGAFAQGAARQRAPYASPGATSSRTLFADARLAQRLLAPAARHSRAAAGRPPSRGHRRHRRHSRVRHSGRPSRRYRGPPRHRPLLPSRARAICAADSAPAWPHWWRNARHRPAPFPRSALRRAAFSAVRAFSHL